MTTAAADHASSSAPSDAAIGSKIPGIHSAIRSVVAAKKAAPISTSLPASAGAQLNKSTSIIKQRAGTISVPVAGSKCPVADTAYRTLSTEPNGALTAAEKPS